MEQRHSESSFDLVLLRNEEQAKARALDSIRSDRSMSQTRASNILEYWKAIYKATDELEYRATVEELERSLERDLDALRELQQLLAMRAEVDGVTDQMEITHEVLRFLSVILDKIKKKRRELAEEAFRNFVLHGSAFALSKWKDKDDKGKKGKPEAQREGRQTSAKDKPALRHKRPESVDKRQK